MQPSDYQTYSFKNFFGGKDSPGTVLVPSDDLLHSFNWQRLASFSQEVSSGSMTTQQFYDKYFAATPGLTDSFIQNRAVYAEAKFASNGFGFLPSFSGNFGVRVVQEVLNSKGYFVSTVGNKFYLDQGTATIVAFSPTPTPQNDDYYQGTTSYSLRKRNYGYVRVLPAFNVKFDVTPKFIVRLAASKGMADPTRVCMVGIGFGGYAALKAAENGRVRCAASVDGVTDTASYLAWREARTPSPDPDAFASLTPSAQWPRTFEDAAYSLRKLKLFLGADRPAINAAQMRAPVLLMHQSGDSLVPESQSRKLNDALQAAGKPVEYVRLKGAGHAPDTEAARLAVLQSLTAFLARYNP